MKNGVAAIGLCSWDRFLVTAHFPGPGQYAIVERRLEQAGGTTSNTCAALARVGIPTTLASCVGDDDQGERMIESLRDAGCDVSHVRVKPGQATDNSYIVVSGKNDGVDRTIYWVQGARPELGDRLPVQELLDYRWLILDVDSEKLRSFWLDLPAHQSPRTQLIGLMTYLVETDPDHALEQALRCDVLIGNQAELMYLTRTSCLDEAIDRFRTRMQGQACRKVFVSHGRFGATAFGTDCQTSQPAFDLAVADTTGAGDAFAAGCIWGLFESTDDSEALRRGNALGGLTCTALGARTAQPDRDEALRLLENGIS